MQPGLATCYNRQRSPEDCERVLDLRRLHEDLDRAVLEAYGWSDIEVTPHETPEIEEGKRRLESFEDEIVDLLFVLNAQRAEEERRLGLRRLVESARVGRRWPGGRRKGRRGRGSRGFVFFDSFPLQITRYCFAILRAHLPKVIAMKSFVRRFSSQVTRDLRTFHANPHSYGTVKLAIYLALGLRLLSLGALLKVIRRVGSQQLHLSPGTSSANEIEEQKAHRRAQDLLIEIYLFTRFSILIVAFILCPIGSLAYVAAAGLYFIFETLVTAMSTLLLANHPELHKAPSSIGRSLMLQMLNIAETTLVFATIYRIVGSDPLPLSGLVDSSLVLGTLGFPRLEGNVQLFISGASAIEFQVLRRPSRPVAGGIRTITLLRRFSSAICVSSSSIPGVLPGITKIARAPLDSIAK
jgi:hypothetical protein